MTTTLGAYGAGPYGDGPYGKPKAEVVEPARAQGFVLNEDAALKLKLENYGNDPFYVINYADYKHIPITVYYRSPDVEIRKRSFPHITIDLIDIQPDYERMHRSMGYVPIAPAPDVPEAPPEGFSLWEDQWPFPWMLIYQLSAISRDPTHDRQLSQLFHRMFPFAYGSLDMSMFDGSCRRADFQGMTRRDLPADATNKRIFRQIYTIGVSSEFLLSEVEVVMNVITVNVEAEEITTGSQ